MNFFLFDDKISKQFGEIKRLMNASMNGVVSERMSQLGYKVNFGVSLIRIKEICSRYEKNTKLANMLWKSECRELKIAATLLQDENNFSIKDSLIWIEDCFNQELREQLASNLLVRLPNFNELLDNLIKKDEDSNRIMLFIVSAFAVRQNKLINSYFYKLMKIAEEDVYKSDKKVVAISRFLKAGCKEYKDEISQFIENLKADNNEYLAWLKEEVRTEIEFGS